MGAELTSATDIDRLLGYSALSTPIFILIGKEDFFEPSYGFYVKMSPKKGTFEVSWISRRGRVGF